MDGIFDHVQVEINLADWTLAFIDWYDRKHSFAYENF